MCGLSGLVVFKINYRENRVQRSWVRTLYSLLYFLFFTVTFNYAFRQSYQGLEEIVLIDKTSTLNANIEICVSYIMTVLLVLLLVRNFKSTRTLFTEILKAASIKGFEYKLSKQLRGVIAFGEVSLVFVYFTNLFWFSWKGWYKLVTFDLWENMTITGCVINVPVSLAARASIAITLVIDFVQKLVTLLNHRIEQSLKLAESSENFKVLEYELEKVSQLYFEISSIVKLLEKSFGSIIAVLQCAALIIGVNQVKSFQRKN